MICELFFQTKLEVPKTTKFEDEGPTPVAKGCGFVSC